MIEPRERLLWIVVGVAVIGVVGLAVPFVGGFAPYALALVVVAVVVDVVWARPPSMVRVQRRVPERLIEGRAGVVAYDVVSDRALDVEVVDGIPGEPWLVARAAIVAGTTTLTPPARVRRRGRHVGPALTVRTFGPLGLVARRQRRHSATGDDVVVALDVAAIADGAARAIRSGDLDGRRRRRLPGQGKELDGLRPYRRGDDVRLVDWKASARRGDLVVKELVPETRQDVVVVVDAGRQLMGHTAAGGRRFDRAVAVGLFVAATAIERGDRAGIAVVDDDVRAFVPPREGRATLKQLADAVDVDAIAVEPAYQELAALLGTRLKRRSVICLVTDVVDEAGATALARSLVGLRQRHAVIVVALADATLRQLATPDDADDNDTTLRRRAAQLLLAHRRRALQLLERSAVVVDVDDDGADGHGAGSAAVAAWWRLKQAGRV